jgi:lipoate-protein ligase A
VLATVPNVETWRLITTWGADPAFNMGLDEALLESDESPPTVRFYSWSPETLSLGYFQRIAEVPGATSVVPGQRKRVVVRRITGGGAIHHVNELTYSITAPLAHRVYQCSLGESYTRVHTAIQRALAQLGVDASPRGATLLTSDRGDTGMCFHHSTELDLVWLGRKGVGSAQRRKKGRVLHHGSIKLGTSPLEGEIATVREVAPDVSCETFAPILRKALSSAFQVQFEAGVPTPDERARAKELGKRYLDPEFVRRR